MTIEEVMAMVARFDMGAHRRNTRTAMAEHRADERAKAEIRAAILALIDAEAEACAEVCDAEDNLTADYLATAIRARIASRKAASAGEG